MSHKKSKRENEPVVDGKNDIINANRNVNGPEPMIDTAGKAKKEKKKY